MCAGVCLRFQNQNSITLSRLCEQPIRGTCFPVPPLTTSVGLDVSCLMGVSQSGGEGGSRYLQSLEIRRHKGPRGTEFLIMCLIYCKW